jgi:hypothetical protein
MELYSDVRGVSDKAVALTFGTFRSIVVPRSCINFIDKDSRPMVVEIAEWWLNKLIKKDLSNEQYLIHWSEYRRPKNSTICKETTEK